MTDLLTLARDVGFSQCAAVNMDALDPLEAVRDMCKADRCPPDAALISPLPAADGGHMHALPYLHLSGPSLPTSQAEAFFDGGLRTVRQ